MSAADPDEHIPHQSVAHLQPGVLVRLVEATLLLGADSGAIWSGLDHGTGHVVCAETENKWPRIRLSGIGDFYVMPSQIKCFEVSP